MAFITAYKHLSTNKSNQPEEQLAFFTSTLPVVGFPRF